MRVNTEGSTHTFTIVKDSPFTPTILLLLVSSIFISLGGYISSKSSIGSDLAYIYSAIGTTFNIMG
ncbi:MAG: hypothetical protein OEZ01_18025, partial [Candidatus Heimdallarchaeota archaeon]|nr:hypothetical protein [Candidatus Heimdallarchaeota archaeon]